MGQNKILLFVMKGCQLCPQMERLFQRMYKDGAFVELSVQDVAEHPELAQEYSIRSVPFYLINGVGFSGLRTQQQIEQLLQQNEDDNWQTLIVSELSEGQLAPVEKMVRQQPAARVAMMKLLADSDTTLVVRIGLTAVIEGLADDAVLTGYHRDFILLTQHSDERVAIDALYYLSLIRTPDCLDTLLNVSKYGSAALAAQASELLDEIASESK